MDRRSFTKILGTGLAASALPGSVRSAFAAEPLKVGFVYLGPVGDFGWTYQHDVGRKEAVAALGDKVSTTFVENVPESADAERVINDLAAKGHKLIFTTSFGYMKLHAEGRAEISENLLRTLHGLQARRQCRDV